MDGLRELDRIGTLVAGKYRLESILGRGGMGTVYRATHSWTGQPVAVKCLHQEYAHDVSSVGRFLREARAAAAVRHPNAVDVLDMGQDEDGSAYLVLELLDGDTLAGHLASYGRMTPEEVVRYLAPVFEALEELHHAGVVHRDLKPANIFLARSSRGLITPKLLDFGVAKVLEANSSLVTTTGIVVGTPAYMAPEQAAGNGNIGPWTDIWAAGTVLFECFTGELPFMAPTPSLMLVDIMTKTAPRLATRRPDLDPAVCAVVDRALAKEPRERFPSLSDLVQALCRAAGVSMPPHGHTPSGRPPSAFAMTEHAMATPAPAAAPTLPAGMSVQPPEPAATGPTTTARTRAPRRRTVAAAGIVAFVLVFGALALRFRDGGQGNAAQDVEPAASSTPPAALSAPIAPAPSAPAPVDPPDPADAEPVVLSPEPQAEPTAPAAGTESGSAQTDAARERAERRAARARAKLTVAPPAVSAPAAAKPAEKTADDPRAPTVEREW